MKKYKDKVRKVDALKITMTANNKGELTKAKVPYRVYSEGLIIVNPGVQDLHVKLGQYLVKAGEFYEVADAEAFETYHEVIP
jgi:hypothetical protein